MIDHYVCLIMEAVDALNYPVCYSVLCISPVVPIYYSKHSLIFKIAQTPGFFAVNFGSSFCVRPIQTTAKRFICQLLGANALIKAEHCHQQDQIRSRQHTTAIVFDYLPNRDVAPVSYQLIVETYCPETTADRSISMHFSRTNGI